MSKKVASEFWKSQKEYPVFGAKQRRYFELMWLIPRLKNTKSLLDVGCGSGELLDLLLRVSDVKSFYGCDISENLLSYVDDRVSTFVWDMCGKEALPEVDTVILWGVIQYTFKDSDLRRMLRRLPGKRLLVRTSCNREELVVNKFSEDLESSYASRYLTLEKTLKILRKYYDILDVSRAYPDDIESKYGTKQWLIECIRRD